MAIGHILLAAALPDQLWLEYAFQDYNHLIEQPVQFVDGSRSRRIAPATA